MSSGALSSSEKRQLPSQLTDETVELPRLAEAAQGAMKRALSSADKSANSIASHIDALNREIDRAIMPRVTDAYDELMDIWEAEGGSSLEGVLHCYTGGLAFAQRAVEAGFCVSFSGILTFKKSGELREVAKALPLDRLLVETDAPFLAPEGNRGKRNEPAWVARVGETLAQLHGVSGAAACDGILLCLPDMALAFDFLM